MLGGRCGWPVSTAANGVRLSEGVFRCSQNFKARPRSTGAPFFCSRFNPIVEVLECRLVSGYDAVAANVARFGKQARQLRGASLQERCLQMGVQRCIGTPLLDEAVLQRVSIVLQQHIGKASCFLARRLDEPRDDLTDRASSFRTGVEMGNHSNRHSLHCVEFSRGLRDRIQAQNWTSELDLRTGH